MLCIQPRDSPPNRMVQTARARNDYFSAQFLLSFPVPGVHLVHVEAAVEDGEGVGWTTGPRTSVLVRAYDEAASKQQQIKFAAGSR